MDAFRTISQQQMMLNLPPRQTTSNIGHLKKPSLQALMHGLNRAYYSLNIECRKDEFEQAMLLSLHKQTWTNALKHKRWREHDEDNLKSLKTMVSLAKDYQKRLDEEEGKTPLEILLATAGKLDPKKHLENQVEEVLSNNISQTLGTMLDSIVF